MDSDAIFITDGSHKAMEAIKSTPSLNFLETIIRRINWRGASVLIHRKLKIEARCLYCYIMQHNVHV